MRKRLAPMRRKLAEAGRPMRPPLESAVATALPRSASSAGHCALRTDTAASAFRFRAPGSTLDLRMRVAGARRAAGEACDRRHELVRLDRLRDVRPESGAQHARAILGA